MKLIISNPSKRVFVSILYTNKFVCSQQLQSINRKRRDELQHNVFLMLQETNKFREHQSRELLIEILEEQNEERGKLIRELEDKMQQTDALLLDENPSNTISMDESS